MMNIMLVDDEILALEYLKNMLDWEAHGYHIVGTATNGKKALELFEKTRPQVVISDIRMPGMDGLELTRLLKEKDQAVAVLLLSAYRDFDYAQKAIRYGVTNYLLKHELTAESILSEMQQMKEKLEQEENRKKIYQKYFMNQLIHDQIATEEIDRDVLGNRCFLILLHKCRPLINGEFMRIPWEEQEQKILREILEEGMENIVAYTADVQISENNWMVLYRIENTVSKYMINSLIIRKAAQIAEKLENQKKNAFHLIYSMEIRQDEISDTFRKMSHQIRYEVFRTEGVIAPVIEIPERTEKIIWGKEIHTIRDAVYSSEKAVKESVKAVFQKLFQNRDFENAKALFRALGSLLNELCKEENVRLNLELPLYTMEDIQNYYTDSFIEISKKHLAREELGYSRIVIEVMDHIQENYWKDLSLEQLGERFHMNGVYLGQIFKKETGNTFLKYLTNVRIEEAKRLLREENKTAAETAYLVGYKTSQYFSQIFMKNVGMKPQEYKRQREEV